MSGYPYPSRPTQGVAGWAETGVVETGIPAPRISTGLLPGEPLPAGVYNLTTQWTGLLDELCPLDTVKFGWDGSNTTPAMILKFSRWQDPEDPAYGATWGGQSGVGGWLGMAMTRWTWSVTGDSSTIAPYSATWTGTDGAGTTYGSVGCTFLNNDAELIWTRGAAGRIGWRLPVEVRHDPAGTGQWHGIAYGPDSGGDYPTETHDLTPGRGRSELWPPFQDKPTVFTVGSTFGGGISLEASGTVSGAAETVTLRIPLPAMTHPTEANAYTITSITAEVELQWTTVPSPTAGNGVTLELRRPGAANPPIATATVDASDGDGPHTLTLIGAGSEHTVVESEGTAYWVEVEIAADNGEDLSVYLDSITMTVQPQGVY